MSEYQSKIELKKLIRFNKVEQVFNALFLKLEEIEGSNILSEEYQSFSKELILLSNRYRRILEKERQKTKNSDDIDTLLNGVISSILGLIDSLPRDFFNLNNSNNLKNLNQFESLLENIEFPKEGNKAEITYMISNIEISEIELDLKNLQLVGRRILSKNAIEIDVAYLSLIDEFLNKFFIKALRTKNVKKRIAEAIGYSSVISNYKNSDIKPPVYFSSIKELGGVLIQIINRN